MGFDLIMLSFDMIKIKITIGRELNNAGKHLIMQKPHILLKL
jgi:hypothetical protein